MNNIPVILMTYNRPEHTGKVLESLRKHNISKLFIFSDGPKRVEHENSVLQVRELVRGVDWCKPVITERAQNFGLAKSIVAAVNTVFEQFDRLILLEDDCVPQQYFFDFMAKCLEKYEADENVFGISGHTVPIGEDVLEMYPYDMYFSPRIGSWGWATWKRAWQYYDTDIKRLVEIAKAKNIDWNQGGNDWPVMFAKFLRGEIKDVWTMNWVLSVYNNNGSYIFPTRSHIANIGTDGSGIHCSNSNKYNGAICDAAPSRFPDRVFYDKNIMCEFWKKFDVRPRRVVSLPVTGTHKETALRVAHINTVDNAGGAAKVAWTLKEAIKARGLVSELFVGKKASDAHDVTAIIDPLLDCRENGRKTGLLDYEIKSTYRLSGNERFTSFDIFNFHNLHGGYFNLFALPELTQRKPSIWTLHDMQPLTGHCAHSFDCRRWKTGCGDCPNLAVPIAVDIDKTAQMWADRQKIYSQCDITIVVPSQWLAGKVSQSLLKDKVCELIYNGIDTSVFRPTKKEIARAELNLPQNAVILVFSAQAGMNSPWRDGECLAQTIKYLNAKDKNVYFLNVGNSANTFNTPNTLNIPYVNDESTLAKIYSAADLLLFPSLGDNCPLSIIESMACGLPVVTYHTGGIPEIVKNGETGLIASYKNVSEFINYVELLIADKTKREGFSLASIERAHRKFSLDTMASSYLALYEKVIEQSRLKSKTQARSKISLHMPQSEPTYEYLVSAIVSTYNSEKFIRGCLQDLVNQTLYKRGKLEIIVVNSGSQQNEDIIAGEFQKKYENIKYIKTQQRETIYAAWNKAIKAASGKYITNANTDDRHRCDALELMAKALDENPGKVLVYADNAIVDDIDGQVVGQATRGEFSKYRLLENCFVGPTPMWRKIAHDAFGYFDEAFLAAGDYEFWLRMAQRCEFFYLNEQLTTYLRRADSLEHQGNGFICEFETALIKKCHNYAAETGIEIDHNGVSSNPAFSGWCETNLWKKATQEKLSGQVSEPVTKDIILRIGSAATLLSVILVTYNRNDALFENLDSLNVQNERNFEVLVVNNGEEIPDFENCASRWGFAIRYIKLDKNYGPSLARNAGIERAISSLVAFLDDDATVDISYVKNIVRHFQEHDIAGLRGRIEPRHDETVPELYNLGHEIINAPAELEGNSAFRKDVLFAIEGFDPYLYCGEGTDLSYRIYKALGERINCIQYFPDVVIFHDGGKNLSAVTEKNVRYNAMGKLYISKNPGVEDYVKFMHSFYPHNKEKLQNDYVTLFNVALFLQKNYPNQAVVWAQKCVALEPSGAKGRYVLGSLYVTLGRYAEAINMLEPILEDLTQTMAADESSLVGDSLENCRNAASCYLSSCTKLAQCYIKLGEYGKVKTIYQHLLQNSYLKLKNEQRAAFEAMMIKLHKVTAAPITIRRPDTTAMPPTLPQINSAEDAHSKYLVSAIISTYNAEKFLRGCLDDLLRQTIADKIEIIVVNSGSQENEEAIVREYQRKHRNIVYIKTEQREGIYAAWNRAAKIARGQFITNANTDDRHRVDFLEIMARELIDDPKVGLVYADQISSDTPNATFENHNRCGELKWDDYSYERLKLGCCTGSQPMWRKSMHAELGYFDESLTCAGDWDFWLRIASKHPLKHVAQFLGLYYHNRDGIEHGRKIHSLYERYVVGQRYGTPYIAVIPYIEGPAHPLVSVIVPAYNAQDYIRRTIESVLIQSYRNIELIIIDDGSTDRTAQIVAGFKDSKIRYTYKKNGGASSARNLGIRESKGRFLVMLDADDMMLPDYIVNHMRHFQNQPDADLVYCDHCLIDVNDKPIRELKQFEYQDKRHLIRDMFRCGYPIIQPRGCLKKNVFEKIGNYDDSLVVGEDYDLMRRFIMGDLKAYHLPESLYLRRIQPESLSQTNDAQKANAHFEVIKRFVESFRNEELFPDVNWQQIPPDRRQVYAECLIGATYRAIGKNYAQANAPLNARIAFESACAALKKSLQIDTDNSQARILLDQCENAKKQLCVLNSAQTLFAAAATVK